MRKSYWFFGHRPTKARAGGFGFVTEQLFVTEFGGLLRNCSAARPVDRCVRLLCPAADAPPPETRVFDA